MADIHIPNQEGRRAPDPRSITRLIVLAIIIFAALSVFSTVFYTLETKEVGVILRFGKYVRTTYPGLHMKLPFGIETLIKVEKTKIFTEEFGFRTKKAGVKTEYFSEREAKYMFFRQDNYSSQLGFTDPFLGESLMLTGDLNCVDVEWALYWKVRDAVKFCFNVRNVKSSIRDISEATLRHVIGDVTIDEILTERRDQIQEQAKEKLQDILDSYESGVEITRLVLQDVNPPTEVKPSFNEVNEAMQEKERITNQARAKYNRIIPQKRGEAEKMIRDAEGYALNRINKAKGDADRFLAIWEEYKNAKEVTRRRMYLEMIKEVLPRVHKKVVVDSDISGILPLYNLSQEDVKGGAQ